MFFQPVYIPVMEQSYKFYLWFASHHVANITHMCSWETKTEPFCGLKKINKLAHDPKYIIGIGTHTDGRIMMVGYFSAGEGR